MSNDGERRSIGELLGTVAATAATVPVVLGFVVLGGVVLAGRGLVGLASNLVMSRRTDTRPGRYKPRRRVRPRDGSA